MTLTRSVTQDIPADPPVLNTVECVHMDPTVTSRRSALSPMVICSDHDSSSHNPSFFVSAHKHHTNHCIACIRLAVIYFPTSIQRAIAILRRTVYAHRSTFSFLLYLDHVFNLRIPPDCVCVGNPFLFPLAEKVRHFAHGQCFFLFVDSSQELIQRFFHLMLCFGSLCLLCVPHC